VLSSAIKFLLADMGQPLQIEQGLTAPTYSPAAGLTEPTIVTYEAIGCVVDYASKDKDGTSILQSDRKALIAAKGLAITPKVSNKIVFEDLKYRIIAVHTIREGSDIVAHVCQVRL